MELFDHFLRTLYRFEILNEKCNVYRLWVEMEQRNGMGQFKMTCLASIRPVRSPISLEVAYFLVMHCSCSSFRIGLISYRSPRNVREMEKSANETVKLKPETLCAGFSSSTVSMVSFTMVLHQKIKKPPNSRAKRE